MKFVVGEQVWFQDEYHWYNGVVTSCGPRNVKISCLGRIYTKPKEKCATKDEYVAPVWEMWKGKNGRGGYRVERELYPNERKPAHMIGPNDRLWEDAPGNLTKSLNW